MTVYSIGDVEEIDQLLYQGFYGALQERGLVSFLFLRLLVGGGEQ